MPDSYWDTFEGIQIAYTLLSLYLNFLINSDKIL